MSKSIKLSNDIYLDSSSVVHNKKKLSEILNTKDVYSNNEIKTNKVYKDGKPIYRKEMNLGALPNNNQASYNFGIDTIDNIVDYEVCGIKNGDVLPLPYVYPSTSYIDRWITIEFITKSKITIITGYDRSDFNLRVILEYTKITD